MHALFLPDHLLLSARLRTWELTSSVFSPPLPPPVAFHKGALGALVVNLYPHGTCWSPWHLSPSGWPQSRYGSRYRASESESACPGRLWRTATTSRHNTQCAFEKQRKSSREWIKKYRHRDHIYSNKSGHFHGLVGYWLSSPLAAR